jgi:MFS transporter, FHS family, L-fucose permease
MWQLLLLISLFILWGACNALNDVLIRAFQTALSLGDAESSLVQTAFYTGYCLGALPAAALARCRGYKICVCVGLGLVCSGSALFWPCSRGSAPWYPPLLGCLYLLAFGLAFLECSANPWVVLLAERRRSGSGTRALNLAQSFNPIGSVGGVLLGRQLILANSAPVRLAPPSVTSSAPFLLRLFHTLGLARLCSTGRRARSRRWASPIFWSGVPLRPLR